MMSSFAPLCYTVKGLGSTLVTAKGSETDIAFTTGTEADTWSTNHIGTIEQRLEELP